MSNASLIMARKCAVQQLTKTHCDHCIDREIRSVKENFKAKDELECFSVSSNNDQHCVWTTLSLEVVITKLLNEAK